MRLVYQFIQFREDSLLALDADKLLDDRTVFENHEGRDRHHHVFLRDRRVFVDVEFANFHFT